MGLYEMMFNAHPASNVNERRKISGTRRSSSRPENARNLSGPQNRGKSLKSPDYDRAGRQQHRQHRSLHSRRPILMQETATRASHYSHGKVTPATHLDQEIFLRPIRERQNLMEKWDRARTASARVRIQMQEQESGAIPTAIREVGNQSRLIITPAGLQTIPLTRHHTTYILEPVNEACAEIDGNACLLHIQSLVALILGP
jgi:hypothetical protein